MLYLLFFQFSVFFQYTSVNQYGFGDSYKPLLIRKLEKPLASNCLCGSYPSPVPSVQNKLPSNGKLPLNTTGSKESGQQIRKYFWLAALTHNPFLSQLLTIQCKSMWISSPQISIGRTRLPSFSSYSGVSHVHKVSPFFLSINL